VNKLPRRRGRIGRFYNRGTGGYTRNAGGKHFANVFKRDAANRECRQANLRRNCAEQLRTGKRIKLLRA
jgi:hypothetical protein